MMRRDKLQHEAITIDANESVCRRTPIQFALNKYWYFNGIQAHIVRWTRERPFWILDSTFNCSRAAFRICMHARLITKTKDHSLNKLHNFESFACILLVYSVFICIAFYLVCTYLCSRLTLSVYLVCVSLSLSLSATAPTCLHDTANSTKPPHFSSILIIAYVWYVRVVYCKRL